MQLSVSVRSSNLVLIRFMVLQILRFLYFAVLAWNCLFTPILGGFGGIFPPNMVTHRSNPKRTILARKHVVWAIKRENRSSGSTWAQDREKKGKDRTVKQKSQSGNISPIWGAAPTAPIETKFCMVGHLAVVITYAKFQVEIFRGYDFTGGRISHFPIDFCMGGALQQCSATALPVIDLLQNELLLDLTVQYAIQTAY